MQDQPMAPRLRLIDGDGVNVVTPHANHPVFQPAIQLDDIFRELIRTELRHGRLSAWRRRRIVQYAAQLHLSAVAAGRLITRCREEALAEPDPRAALPALHVGDEPVTYRSLIWNVAAIMVGLTLILAAIVGV